jgi:hypothetical protein
MSIKIHGKNYITVNERLQEFRAYHKDYSLKSNIEYLEGGMCVVKATIENESGRVLANGLAYEKEGSSNINKTSYVENCETSAWGRALANFGIGIDDSVASADEVANALKLQATPPKPPDNTPIDAAEVKRLCTIITNNPDGDMEKFDSWIKTKYNVDSKKDIPKRLFKEILSAVEKK